MAWMFCEKETDTKARVMLIYNVEPPAEFIEKQQNAGRIVVEATETEKEQKVGKKALPYVNPQTGEFWYEYVDRPLTPEEQAQQLQDQIDAMALEILNLKGV